MTKEWLFKKLGEEENGLFLELEGYDELKIEGLLAKDMGYINQTKICALIFRQLSEMLSAEQKVLLLKYDEATAFVEVLIINALSKRISDL